jgi:glucokinase
MSVITVSSREAQRPLFAGVDVGGTGIKFGLVDEQGRSLGKVRIDTLEERGPADALQRTQAALDRQIQSLQVSWDEIAWIGLGTPGTMDIPNGLILAPPNLPNWRNFPVRDELARLTGKPVAFANDANAAAYGEYWVGSGRDAQSMIMLTLGTGVGGGVIVDEQLIDGVNSFGSECGHLIIDSRPDARLCVWGGGRGQLEAYASASALVERTREVLATGRESSLRSRMEREELTPLMMAEEANRGDRLSMEMIEETGRYLGIGVASLVHIIDPGLVVLGGAMNFGGEATEAGRRFLAAVREEFRSRAFDVVADTTTIAFASLGGDAGYIGAAGIAHAAWKKKLR